jgi:hypothetical protein
MSITRHSHLGSFEQKVRCYFAGPFFVTFNKNFYGTPPAISLNGQSYS